MKERLPLYPDSETTLFTRTGLGKEREWEAEERDLKKVDDFGEPKFER